ncbi:Fe-S cluster assembly protein SufD [Bifidobacterium bombi]|uniref:FeS assembly protein SufD n=1 Tax=Bifidobacterium bombi DSM 19703 TaxID=1341695 RepID=A0A080N2F2_9BIFI|nr:Fe-S cluster assembly protein SufD [Bifidobacterium bombi]KFF31147.1 FeS assembly protein SufD [Bifidobacterium bombi DSM 19703]
MAGTKEINIPVMNPDDPYAMPAAMPSSADREPRSFDLGAFTKPTSKQDDWRFTPVERLEEFLDSFEPSGRTVVSVTNIDGTAIDGGIVQISHVARDVAPSGTVSRPSDRAAAVEWNVGHESTVVTLKGGTEQPVLVSVQGGGFDLDSLHLVIVAEPGVTSDVVVEHHGDARLAEGVEIIVGENAHVSTTFVQEWGKGSKHVGNQRIHVGANATLRHSMVTLGGEVVRIRIDQDFGGPQGKLSMLGIYFVEPGAHIEHRTMVVHNQPDCTSRVIYKGALDGRKAHSTWVGNALIRPCASGTDSYELNRNLVLTHGAVADSEPNLEIENGDIVGAGHASSVGRFDDEQLFYLQSRGIPEMEARKLVVRGFFGDLVEQIAIPAISEHLMNVIDRRLARGESEAMQAVLEDK